MSDPSAADVQADTVLEVVDEHGKPLPSPASALDLEAVLAELDAGVDDGNPTG